jgi:hypothetical protein
MDELLQGAWSNVPPSARTHLLHLLEALWRDEIRYGPFGAPAYDEDDME